MGHGGAVIGRVSMLRWDASELDAVGLQVSSLECVNVNVLSGAVVSDYLQPPWTVARQAPLSMGFSRQEYWSGLPFPSPLKLTDPHQFAPMLHAISPRSRPTFTRC